VFWGAGLYQFPVRHFVPLRLCNQKNLPLLTKIQKHSKWSSVLFLYFQ
jgi:hypothetical protein